MAFFKKHTRLLVLVLSSLIFLALYSRFVLQLCCLFFYFFFFAHNHTILRNVHVNSHAKTHFSAILSYLCSPNRVQRYNYFFTYAKKIARESDFFVIDS